MNRNQMYNYLKEIELFPKVHWGDRGYHVEFVEDTSKNYEITGIVFDWGFVRGVDSIHLCADEIVIECKFGFGKINVYYKNIDKFEVKMIEKDEEF